MQVTQHRSWHWADICHRSVSLGCRCWVGEQLRCLLNSALGMNAYGWGEKEAGLRKWKRFHVVDLTTWHPVAILPHANIKNSLLAPIMGGLDIQPWRQLDQPQYVGVHADGSGACFIPGHLYVSHICLCAFTEMAEDRGWLRLVDQSILSLL